MKTSVFVILLLLVIYSCSSLNNKNFHSAVATNDLDTLRIANDSLEYEILIIEPGFNNWLVTQKPIGFYSETFLENRNQQYVLDYNQRVLQS